MNTSPNPYATDWSNIDLSSSERRLNILEPYSFDTLLLEVYCNLREEQLTSEAIEAHALSILRAKLDEATEILRVNLANIVAKAKEEREDI